MVLESLHNCAETSRPIASAKIENWAVVFRHVNCVAGEEWACTTKWTKNGNVSFSVGKEILEKIISSRSYGKGLSLMKVNECLVYAKRVLETVCLPGQSFSPRLCCAAVRSAIDDGNCLCEPYVG